ncbi:hypothetical protein ILUMI_07848 [Ignelater luminosus]|uniref:Transferrin-like domain-containing protein n=1 Tax=Ignelater luminosus TaxID=2038154 RepID=A0A8K0D800_IGNLU|nr:hypothetical protein ILUMI_07848 [Ignelater luminosus]
MKCINRTYVFIFVLIIHITVTVINCQRYRPAHGGSEYSHRNVKEKIIWCTVSVEEQQKCLNFAMAVERDRIRVGYDYFEVECKQAFNKDECMMLLDEEKVSLTSLDAGQVFVGGRYHSLVPIAQQVADGNMKHYYAVAVVKAGADNMRDVHNIRQLRGKRACFAGVGTMAGWVIPIYTLMREGGLEIIDCNNHVKSATEFFGPSCAVNSLTDKYNPIGDNSDKLCRICTGKVPGGKCTDSDPYAGFEGAFRCLLETGDVAFLKHTTVEELTSGIEFGAVAKDIFELLCRDGSRRPIHDYQNCNWGDVPLDAVVTTSATPPETRKKYQKFLQKAAEIYGLQGNGSHGYDNRDRGGYDDRNRDEYDQYGNRIRYRRQTFGDFGSQNNNNRYGGTGQSDRFDQYSRSNTDPQNRDRDPYNQDDRDRFNQDNRDGYNRDPYFQGDNRDSFNRDPYVVNRDRYGVNIDPYNSDPNPNRDRDPLYHDNRVNYTFNSFTPYNRTNVTYYEVFNLFESSPKYGIHGNLLFQDVTRNFVALSENQQTFSGFLGDSLHIILGVRQCPVNHMTLCVTSDPELEKCIKMRTALKAQLLKPEMRCEKAHSQINCMQKIRSRVADVAVFDASDVYTAGLNFDLVPFISEIYNLGKPEYYVVAVAKEADPSTELTYLRGKYTCHGGINTAAGWVYPLAYLISNGWIRPYGCNSIRAAAEYFTKSCVPGALSTEYNTGVPYDNLCDLCHGASFRYCRRDASEDYYGHTGAFRCLVEGGGHVAFVKHTTVLENAGGHRREWWSRDALIDDFELLCPDGTRAEIQDYRKCNLGVVKSNAIVTRGGYDYNETEINAFINVFLYSQTFYGRKSADEFSFSMFSSTPPFTDLIFQDSTQQLKIIEPNQRYYSTYLGNDYMRARRIVDCHAGTNNVQFSAINILVSSILTIILSRYLSR